IVHLLIAADGCQTHQTNQHGWSPQGVSPHCSTTLTVVGPNDLRNRRVDSRSNCGSVASIARKKRSRVACANRGTLNTGWYGMGSPLSASMPKSDANDAMRIVSSNVTGMKAGQLLSGRPPTLIG